jgi:hypothetical protein
MRAGIALATAFVICGVAAGPALADHDDHHHGHWGHAQHDGGWDGQQHGHFFYPEHDVFYAPPPIVYASPVYPSPGITFFFPLWIH